MGDLSDYQKLGLIRPSLVDSLTLEKPAVVSGVKKVIRISSKNPLFFPFFNLVILAKHNSGTLLENFLVTVDFQKGLVLNALGRKNKKLIPSPPKTKTVKIESPIEKNKVLQSDKMFKLVICGVGKGSTKYYLNKINDFKYQIVSENENPDFVILTNRILTNYNKKKPKLKTCFDKYSGRIIEKVSRKGLILSAIKEFK